MRVTLRHFCNWSQATMQVGHTLIHEDPDITKSLGLRSRTFQVAEFRAVTLYIPAKEGFLNISMLELVVKDRVRELTIRDLAFELHVLVRDR